MQTEKNYKFAGVDFVDQWRKDTYTVFSELMDPEEYLLHLFCIVHMRHPNSRALDVYGEYEELLEEEPHVEFNSKVETEFEDLSTDGKIQGWESKGGNILSQIL
ncbi:hypothetical protein C5167_015614 [Papaver somniferum]|uniref:Uncharacterized protein n=1 Tax=Papaver somniferum TaxID=3469 RepID=A0A4Y7J9N5_PAPSO|nr:hypothetical protein C5167_015614 [Papaver somniferum]